jgi:hypothetical protein
MATIRTVETSLSDLNIDLGGIGLGACLGFIQSILRVGGDHRRGVRTQV